MNVDVVVKKLQGLGLPSDITSNLRIFTNYDWEENEIVLTTVLSMGEPVTDGQWESLCFALLDSMLERGGINAETRKVAMNLGGFTSSTFATKFLHSGFQTKSGVDPSEIDKHMRLRVSASTGSELFYCNTRLTKPGYNIEK